MQTIIILSVIKTCKKFIRLQNEHIQGGPNK